MTSTEIQTGAEVALFDELRGRMNPANDLTTGNKAPGLDPQPDPPAP